MEQAIAWLSGLADRIPLDRPTLALALVFASTVIVAATLAGAMGRRDPVGRRLAGGAPAAGTAGDSSLRGYGAPPKVVQAFRPAAEKLVPKSSEKVGRIRRELIQAGYLAPSAVTVYFAVKLAAAAGLAVAALMLLPLVAPSLDWPTILLAALGGLLAGFLIPGFVLAMKAAKRRKLVRNAFPDGLDLLLVCVEAGLGIDAAIARVADEIEKAHPVLAWHLRIVGSELRAGQSRAEALRGFARRTGVDEVRAFVTLLIQSDELGTSMADTLRVHAFEMRAARMLRAEESAHKVPVKLAFPLMLGLIPVVMTIVMAPIVVNAVRKLLPALANASVPGAG